MPADDKMADANGVRIILDALREVPDERLDDLQSMTASNSTADAMAPWLQRWLFKLFAEERERRETGVEPSYSTVNPLEWPADELSATALYSIGILECAAAIEPQSPTITQFAATLAKVFASNLAARLMSLDPTRVDASG